MKPEADQRKKHFNLAWLLLIVLPAYVGAGFLCRGHDLFDSLMILWHATEFVCVLCAIPLGISYGLQEKEFWM